MSALVWHYTTGECLARILGDEKIVPATVGVEVARGERPAVWFTTRETFEPTTRKAEIRFGGARHLLTVEEMRQRAGGLFRIGIEAASAPHNWTYHARRGGVATAVARRLERNAMQDGSDPQTWRVIYGDVPASMWRAIQTSLDGIVWTDDADATAAFIGGPA